MSNHLTKEQEALLAIFSRLKKKDRVYMLALAQALLHVIAGGRAE